MTTTKTTQSRPRRTFKEVAKDAYEIGFAEGVERASKNAREELDRMSEANVGLARTVLALETKLANVSLRKLAWSRITSIFKQGN
jgi:flagellar biosynthesis/type III secretory pathway protein FliH